MPELLSSQGKSGVSRWYPQPDSPGWKRILLRLLRAGWSFWHDDCVDRASLLAYTTLLAIVPLLAVVFSLWNMIGFAADKRPLVERIVFQSFVPQVGDTIIHWLNVLAARGASLGWFGLIGLIFTALLLIVQVERHFNAIWGMPKKNHFLHRLFRYIILILLAPIASAILLLSLGPVQHWLSRFGTLPVFPEQLNLLIAFLVEMLFFAFLYRVLPAANVYSGDAFAGAFSASVLLSLAKLLLTLYFQYSTTQTLYGALGLLPVFLLWLYLVWLSVLFGAEVAAARQVREGSSRD